MVIYMLYECFEELRVLLQCRFELWRGGKVFANEKSLNQNLPRSDS